MVEHITPVIESRASPYDRQRWECVCQTSCLPLPSTAVILSSAIILSLTFRSSALPSRLLALATEAPSKEKHTADNTIEHNRIIWTMCVLARAQGKRNKKKRIKKNGRTTAIFRRSSSNISLNIIGSFLSPRFYFNFLLLFFFLIRHSRL